MLEESPKLSVQIVPRKFWRSSKLDDVGKVVTTEYVTWVKKDGGMLQNAPATTEKVARMPRYFPAEWAVVKPAYDAWKEGREEVLNGTPLSAVSFVSSDKIEALALVGIKTVEDLADTNDAALDRIGIGARKLRDNARTFIRSKDGRETESKIAEMQATIDSLKAKLEGGTSEVQPAPRRGRPPLERD